MSERRDKSNKKFMLLSAIGIFMVVDHHTFTAFNFFGNVLPYDSFYMPMFVLISGYFNKVDSETNLWNYFVKKLKTLLVPYAGISLAAFAIQQLINRIKLGSGMASLPSGYLSYVFKRIVTIGAYGEIVEPMWFVITLFVTLMVYALLRKFLSRFWNSFVMFALFCGLHLFVVYYAKSVEAGSLTYLLVPLKCMFFLPFLELGVIYRKYLEKKHSLLSGGTKIAILFGLLLLNMVRTLYLPNAYDVAFDSIDNLSGFTSPYIVTPLVSSIIGIFFWMTFVELAGKQVAESRFVNFMSCNTFWIMGLHILFFNILNCALMEISLHIIEIRYFDVAAFRDTEWYFWGISDSVKMLYVLVGVTGPLALKWCFERIAVPVNGLITRKINLPAKKAAVRGLCSALAYVLPLALTFGILFGCAKAQSGQESGPELPMGETEPTEAPEFDPFKGIVVTFSGTDGSGTADITRDDTEMAIPMSIEYRIDKASALSNGDVVTVYAFSDYETIEDAAEEIAEAGYSLKTAPMTLTVSGLAEPGENPGGEPAGASEKRVYVYYNGDTTTVSRYLLLLDKLSDDRDAMVTLLTAWTHIETGEAEAFYDSHVTMDEAAVIYETEDSTEAYRIWKAFEAAGAEISVFHAE